MAAALFGKLFQGLYDIELVESEAIGTVGVGEATIPAIKKYNELIQLNEPSSCSGRRRRSSSASSSSTGSGPGHSYLHGFGIMARIGSGCAAINIGCAPIAWPGRGLSATIRSTPPPR